MRRVRLVVYPRDWGLRLAWMPGYDLYHADGTPAVQAEGDGSHVVPWQDLCEVRRVWVVTVQVACVTLVVRLRGRVVREAAGF